MNVEERIQALESLLEKVTTNAAKPRPPRGSLGLVQAATTAASRATDDVAGPAVVAAPIVEPVRTAPPAATAPLPTASVPDDDWIEPTQTFEMPVPLAAPIPGAAKDQKAAAATKTPLPAPAAAKTPAPVATKPVETPAQKAATPAPAAAKPVAAPPAVKPVVAPPTVKPVVTPQVAAKPATPAPPANAPIPLTNKVPAPVIKTPAVTMKGPEPYNISKTLTGVGDGAVKAPDLRAAIASGGLAALTGDSADAAELEKKVPPIKAEPSKLGLPSAIADSDGEEDAEPTQLYEASAASMRAAELAAMAEKQLEAAKLDILGDKKGESDKVELRLGDKKSEAEKLDVDAPKKLDLPWVEKKSEPEAEIDVFASKPEPEKKAEPEVVAAQKKSDPELDIDTTTEEPTEEKIELDVAPPKPVAKPEPEKKPKPAPMVAEEKPVIAKPDPAPVLEKKPVVEMKQPVFEEPPPEVPTTSSKGVPKLLIVAAVILLLAAGGFVALKQGWLGGGQPQPQPTNTVAAPTNTAPTAAPTQTAAPTATTTAQPTAAAPVDSAAPAASASAAAPADSATAPPADSAAAPPASAAAEPPPAPGGAAPGTPSVDPATLNNNQGLLFITSNKRARVYLTGKLVGETGTELKVDCGMKFVRLADPNQDPTKPPMWLTPGKPQQIDCRKYTTFSVDVP